jgi:hypothetical protein
MVGGAGQGAAFLVYPDVLELGHERRGQKQMVNAQAALGRCLEAS